MSGLWFWMQIWVEADRLENVEIVHMVAMGKAPYCQPGMEKHKKYACYSKWFRQQNRRD